MKNRLRYLLVMPRLVQSVGDGYLFPLGIAYISSSMKTAGFETATLNLNHHEGDVEQIVGKAVTDNKIDVVATGGLSYQYNTVRAIIEAAKRFSPKIVTIVGGGIITGDPVSAMTALEYADYGVIGEGEITVVELCRALEDMGMVSAVDGIIYREGKEYQITGSRREREDIDAVPWPDYEGFDVGQYLKTMPPGISGLNVGNTIFMLASRSCPYNCTFCFHTIGRRYRQRSLEDFFNELEYLVSRYHIDFICLADELFARDLSRVKEFCSRIRQYNVKWWAQFRVDDITSELIEVIRQGGCEVMSFGLESADNRVLKSMRKGTTVEQIESALKIVYDCGISLEGAFIFGDIAETAETAANTLKWWREHSQYRITLNLITVYPGSFLYEYACQNGIIKDKVEFLREGCPQINVSGLSEAEMALLLRHLMEVPVSMTRTVEKPVVLDVDYRMGRIALEGVCGACGHENLWNDVRLFTMNFLPCAKCGQKFNVPLSLELRSNIDRNVARIVEKYGRIAVWGINYLSADLFRQSTVLQDDRVYPVDISRTKQKMDLYGKTVFNPAVIRTMGIGVVIIAIPVYYTQIESQIEKHYKDVQEVVDLCRLIDPNYEP